MALHDACVRGDVPATVELVVSDVPDAPGLAAARKRGLRVGVADHRAFPDRLEHEKEVARLLDETGPDLICLAGYMRLLSPFLVGRWPRRILNIHPALLPAFPGLHAQRKALEYGVKISGATVHLVDEGTDSGPIVLQRAVPVLPDDGEETLADRILLVEHSLYAEAVRSILLKKWSLKGRRLILE
jgi:phosphoribosylglycinamide formyltransferase-1